MKDSQIHDYTEEKEYSHYNGVKSWYGKHVDAQCREQPKYCEPGEPMDKMKSPHRNTQVGPKI